MKQGAVSRGRPGLVLFFISPIVATLVSGASTVVTFLHVAPGLILFYGGAALLCRELTIRWGKGWPTLLALGAAFGLVAEGLHVSATFDAHWANLGVFRSPGAWGPANGIWVAQMAIYHSLVSIAIPVVLVSLLYPAAGSRRWLRPWMRRALWIVWGLQAIVGALGVIFAGPPTGATLLVLLGILALYLLARRLPTRAPGTGDDPNPSARPLFLLGLVATCTFFVLVYLGPLALDVPLVEIALTAAAVLIFGRVLLRTRRPWSPRRLLALVAGGLAPFLVTAPIQEAEGKIGIVVLGFAAAAVLLSLWWRLKPSVTSVAT